MEYCTLEPGCKKCPVREHSVCDADVYRGSKCASLRAKHGVDFDPKSLISLSTLNIEDVLKALKNRQVTVFLENDTVYMENQCTKERIALIHGLKSSSSQNNAIREAAVLQQEYKKLLHGRKLTKKALVDLCVPFRDKYNLTDGDTLKIAREELSLIQLVDLLENK